MKTDIIIDQETQKVKVILDWKAGNIGQKLTADEAEEVVKLIEHASRAANCEAFKQWLMQFECHTDGIVVDGKTYRFKIAVYVVLSGGFFLFGTAEVATSKTIAVVDCFAR